MEGCTWALTSSVVQKRRKNSYFLEKRKNDIYSNNTTSTVLRDPAGQLV